MKKILLILGILIIIGINFAHQRNVKFNDFWNSPGVQQFNPRTKADNDLKNIDEKKDAINMVALDISNPEHSTNNIIDKDNKLKNWPVFHVQISNNNRSTYPTLVWVEKVINDHEIIVSYISNVSNKTFTNLAYIKLSYNSLGKLNNDCEVKEATNKMKGLIEHSMIYLSIQAEPLGVKSHNRLKIDQGEYKEIQPDDIMFNDFEMLAKRLGKDGFARRGIYSSLSGFSEQEQAAAELSKTGFWGICNN